MIELGDFKLKRGYHITRDHIIFELFKLVFQKAPKNYDDDDGVFLFQEKHETQELYLVTSPRHAWG